MRTHITILPKYISNIKAGVIEQLNAQVGIYSQKWVLSEWDLSARLYDRWFSPMTGGFLWRQANFESFALAPSLLLVLGHDKVTGVIVVRGNT